MKLDRFDKTVVLLVALTSLGLAYLVVRTLPGKTITVDSRSMERDLAAQARMAMIDKLFAPVVLAMEAGQNQVALLKLEEVNVRYPGEAHGFILKGEILNRMGLPDEAVASFVQGVKLNGDYIDRRSPVNHREIIARLVDTSLPRVSSAYRNAPANTTLKANLANLNYLKSRLAGGCE